MSTRRVTNWPRALGAFFESRRAMPFAWGANDCCLFACDGITVITGIDPAQDLRGTYSDALGAARVIQSLGGIEAIAATRCAEHGFAELPSVKLAQRGDVLLHTHAESERYTLALCDGRNALTPGASGLVTVPLARCLRAWRVA